jgi:hypothetical protein
MEESPWFDAIMLGIEHPLGRLLYTTGDVLSAVKLFLGLLRDSESSISFVPDDPSEGEAKSSSSRDKLSLDDFRVAFVVRLGLLATIVLRLIHFVAFEGY